MECLPTMDVLPHIYDRPTDLDGQADQNLPSCYWGELVPLLLKVHPDVVSTIGKGGLQD